MNKRKVLVLGVGLIGSFIAKTLYKEGYAITAIDTNIDNLSKLPLGVDKVFFDASGYNMKVQLDEISPDIVVNATPGNIGHTVLQTVINKGYDIVDISFMPEDPMMFNTSAQFTGSRAVVDFGFAPGMSHVFTGRANKKLETPHLTEIYVGGLQENSNEYKAVFSPIDVIEEYTRPARYIEAGEIKAEEPFEVDYPYYSKELNKSWAGFISDGLRTLLKGTSTPHIVEYTLRSHEHFNFIRQLKSNGFFKAEHLQHTTKVLIDKWKMTETDRDYSILAVNTYDTLNQRSIKHYMYDKYDIVSKDHSMARCTGLPAVAMVKYLLDDTSVCPGVIAPEDIGKDDEVYNYVVGYLKNNYITITETVEELEDE